MINEEWLLFFRVVGVLYCHLMITAWIVERAKNDLLKRLKEEVNRDTP